ncbi:MAG TPA: hypothetical protein VHX59_22030 [Mycobacteriales bacterium]|nr:hypothetical protein [Mycobacteriales bacterium]
MIERLLRSDFLTPRRFAVAATGVVAAVTLTACGGSASGSSSPDKPSAAPSSASGGGAGGGRAGGQFGPAASGKVAAISGTTMQVQSQQNGQVAVGWSTSTKFSHTVTMALSAVKAGACVIATAPSGTSATATSFTAGTVVVTAAKNGSCTGDRSAGGGPSGQRPSGSRPSNRPSGFPSGGAGGGQLGAIAAGKVTSVSGSKVVIAAEQRGSTANSTTNSTVDKTVTVGSATKITTEAATTAHSVQVGKCVTAQGKADSSGTVAATTVQITDPTNGQCGGGFGGFGRGGNRG